MTSLAPDRRAELKARHRQAILAAASGLVDERGGPRFGVDELAERADVSRRTVFNHFASLHDVLLTLCEERLKVLVERFLADVSRAPVGDGSRASMFDELARALHDAQLADAVAGIARLLGDGDAAAGDRSTQPLTDLAFARVGDRLLEEVRRRNPGADPLDAELLVSSLMNGVAVVAVHWLRGCDGRLDAASRREWQRLLTHLLHSIRSGYMPA